MHELNLRFFIFNRNLKKYATLQNVFFFIFVNKYFFMYNIVEINSEPVKFKHGCI